MPLVTDGLIGWWTASRQNGSTWPDQSGNGHDLTVVNADWQDDGGIPYLRSDQGDGTKATTSDAAFQLGSGARSLCVWTKYPAGTIADNRGIAGKMSESSPYPGWGLIWSGSGYAEAHIIQNAGSTIAMVTRSTAPDSSWHMVALTYDGSYLKLYYDGSLVGTDGPHTYNTDNAKDFAICGLGSAQSTGVCGNVRAALVYNTCLSGSDVSDNYAAGPEPVGARLTITSRHCVPYCGETPTTDGNYTVVRFLKSGQFATPDGVTEGEVLVVAGGGGGGASYGAAGAGGGVLHDAAHALTGTISVTVGGGGAGATSAGKGTSGGDSYFGAMHAHGGGGGSYGGGGAGLDGGSGGGGGRESGAGGAATQDNSDGGTGYGYAGAAGHATDYSGGGGGAGAAGSGANGGTGRHYSITGTDIGYAGGGGGWASNWNGTTGGGTATDGGGCLAGPKSGTANRGGGGGPFDGTYAGNGGSGIVIVRYLTPVAEAVQLTITSRHQVGYLATLDVSSRHRVRPLLFVRKTVTSRHLVGYVYTPPPARLALRSRHIVNGVQGLARLALTSRHQVSGLVRFALTSGHLVRDVDPATLTLTSRHVVGFAARLALTSRHKVPRRTVIIPGSDPPIEVVDDVTLHAAFNGINLNNGTTTHVLADGTDVGGNGPEYDTIRHYDGSLLIHDVRGALSTITIPLAVKCSSAASLSAWIADINAACRAGGSFVFQESDGATERTYAIAPGPEPSIPENNRFFLHNSAVFNLVLTRWPE